MDIYNVLRNEFGDRPAEQKLAILRSEMRMPIEKIRGCASLLKKECQSSSLEGLSNDFEICLDEIAEAGNMLKAILDALTG